MSTFSPIMVFAYNRPDHLKKTLSALTLCLDIEQTEVIVVVDGEKGEVDKHKVAEVRDVVELFSSKFSKFSSVIKRSNMGLAQSIRSSLNSVFEDVDSVIVLEDDLLVSEDFILYMNSALKTYSNNPLVGSVSAYCPKLTINSKYDNFFHPRPTSWGWATWKDRWSRGIWEIEEKGVLSRLLLRYGLNKGGQDLYRMLQQQEKGIINSWAILWAYTHYRHEWLVSYPYYSRIQNVGFGEGATHCKSEKNPYPIRMVDASQVRDIYELRSRVCKQGNEVRNVNWYFSNAFKVLSKLGFF
ncbi:hypothetical protein [Teredinibacter sp. KSP-S5-2]|uniref:hypothetical protein n=1 Tax=Teredinibacter sp. KSP-S5-2 TaxID=3034506 RepID=UPI002934B994|nr:hypothetical protein [Teredinibacter sp. KSP-S5-2]WNO07854.1 hypothetical protein P5V12_12770 [Teredinibacter sp. KSP-S5-2]